MKEKLDLQKGGVDNAKIVWYREQIIERELSETTNEATLALQSLRVGANQLGGAEAKEKIVFYMKLEGDLARYRCEYVTRKDK